MLNGNKLLQEAIQKAKIANIPIAEKINPNLEINTRAKKRWGQCKNNKLTGQYDIQLNYLLLADDKKDEAIQTLLHEILHTCKNCMNHGNTWKTYANIINNKYNYDISRTNSAESLGIVKEKSKYLLKCTGCGAEIHREKTSKLITHTNNYRCGKCKSKLVRIY